ncbi:MAG: hypothetical protein WA399_15550 [Acidobacteriaceae bacterium]
MSDRTHFLSWRSLAGLGAVLLLLALAAIPTTAIVVAAAMVLLPVALFGFVLVPLSLDSATDWEPRLAVPVLVRARLFQRPPPISLR